MRSLLKTNVRQVLKSAVEARMLLPFAFVLMLGFLVALAWDGFRSTSELLNSQAYVEHTHQVLHEMDGVEDGLQDAREAWLHYVLTPEKKDLVDFDDAVAQVWVQLDRVATLTRDDASHQARIKELRTWIKDELQQLRDNLRTQHTLLIYHSQDADFRRDRVREGIQKLKDEQERLLVERNKAAQKRADQVARSVTIRISGFSVLMAVLFLLALRDSKRLRIAEQTALHAQNRLQGSLQQLQRESENSKLLNELQIDLQICATPTEAYEAVAGCIKRLLPGTAGNVFANDSARNFMASMASWGGLDNPAQNIFAHDDCCAMRGGRLHSRLEPSRGLACRHFTGGIPVSYICLPMSALGETLGILHISAEDDTPFSPARLAQVQQIGEYAALRLANLKLRERLQDQSIRDPLTGLYNRRFLEAALEQEMHRSMRQHTGTALIMVDVDKFKTFNDTFGHEAGDIVLKEIAALMRRSVRSEDIVCRYGGEEFIAVLPDSSVESVPERAELMRQSIEQLEIDHAGHSLGKITGSFGVAFSQDGDLTPDVLIRQADEALYDAKRRGCNCVSMASSVSNRIAASPHELGDGQESLPIRPRPPASFKRA